MLRILGIGILAAALFLTASHPSAVNQAPGAFAAAADYEFKDGQIIFNITFANNHSAAKRLLFSSGQQYEIIITNEAGEEVYRYSDDRFFTMALVFKNLTPGETLTWQEAWDLTNKVGEKLRSGKYTAAIRVLAAAQDSGAEIPDEQLTAVLELDLTEIAKTAIKETADTVIAALRDKDTEIIADNAHPDKGVRFTPYTYVSVEQDLVFNQEAMRDFFNDENQYLWGYYDGTGWEIRLTPAEYYNRFVYSHDFANTPQIGYNEVLGFGNMMENQFEVYPDAVIVEYYFPGFDPQYEGMDWKSLRLVFEQYEGSWKLVGVIHNEWTI
ncbi:MAG: hypothetical protein GX228_02340 [Firmicutes bacterium]|jgi:hypothetical protein|nr:hypothetical protein [Bacillota bacterium]HKM16638.1 BsuPI-related putative proteinase inhibitor [Limnochordia bacterium]